MENVDRRILYTVLFVNKDLFLDGILYIKTVEGNN